MRDCLDLWMSLWDCLDNAHWYGKSQSTVGGIIAWVWVIDSTREEKVSGVVSRHTRIHFSLLLSVDVM